MRINLNVHGNLRRFLPQGTDQINLELPEGASGLDLISLIGAEHEVGVIAIGRQAVSPRMQLIEGVTVDLYPHLEGG